MNEQGVISPFERFVSFFRCLWSFCLTFFFFLSQERYMAVRACKWVDEVVEAAPYTTERKTHKKKKESLFYLLFDSFCAVSYLEKYNCDFVIHGDDLVVNADGKDCYEAVKKAGKFRTVPRFVKNLSCQKTDNLWT